MPNAAFITATLISTHYLTTVSPSEVVLYYLNLHVFRATNSININCIEISQRKLGAKLNVALKPVQYQRRAAEQDGSYYSFLCRFSVAKTVLGNGIGNA